MTRRIIIEYSKRQKEISRWFKPGGEKEKEICIYLIISQRLHSNEKLLLMAGEKIENRISFWPITIFDQYFTLDANFPRNYTI